MMVQRKIGFKRKRTGIAVGILILFAASGCSAKGQPAAPTSGAGQGGPAAAAVSMETSGGPVLHVEKKEPPQVSASRSDRGAVTKEEAESIALDHAGVKRGEVLYIRTKLDYDDGVSVYEVEFYTDGKEYDYDIVAGTGEIRSYDYDIEHADWKDGAVSEVSPADQGGVTKAEAEEVALKHSGVKRADVLYMKTELDYDDGQLVYEIEFYTDGKEYDYDVIAATGEIKSFDYDIEYAEWRDGTVVEFPSDAQGGRITIEEAKRLVADRIPGVDTSKIWIKEEYDDGRLLYEGEVVHDHKEYEFEIDAKSGQIIEWDVESA